MLLRCSLLLSGSGHCLLLNKLKWLVTSKVSLKCRSSCYCAICVVCEFVILGLKYVRIKLTNVAYCRPSWFCRLFMFYDCGTLLICDRDAKYGEGVTVNWKISKLWDINKQSRDRFPSVCDFDNLFVTLNVVLKFADGLIIVVVSGEILRDIDCVKRLLFFCSSCR